MANGSQGNFGGGFASPLTTKGDIHGYSTQDARLAVGTDGKILEADSTQSTGLKWGDKATAASINLSGAVASLPAAGTAGRTYTATDLPVVLFDDGSTWEVVGNGTLDQFFRMLHDAGLLTTYTVHMAYYKGETPSAPDAEDNDSGGWVEQPGAFQSGLGASGNFVRAWFNFPASQSEVVFISGWSKAQSRAQAITIDTATKSNDDAEGNAYSAFAFHDDDKLSISRWTTGSRVELTTGKLVAADYLVPRMEGIMALRVKASVQEVYILSEGACHKALTQTDANHSGFNSYGFYHYSFASQNAWMRFPIICLGVAA
jgi:hypothetical protein